MRPETLKIIRCVVCAAPLQVAARRAVSPEGRLRDGLLRCRDCGALYPIVGWVPRLLPEAELTAEERVHLESMRRTEVMANENATATVGGTAGAPASARASGPVGPAAPSIPVVPRLAPEERLSESELRAKMEERVRAKLVFDDAPEKLRRRAELDVAYRVYHTEDKGKFIRTARAHLTRPPRRILDVGGGQGGGLTAFRLEFRPELAMLLDLDAEWVELAWLRDPDTEVIRADATRMPLADASFDLMFSTATLEHIPDWRSAVREMVRVSAEGLLCYNPNAGFPYDAGHLDAPFVTWLPKAPAAYVALLWHRLRATGRSLQSIRSELEVTHYVHRARVVRQLRRSGAEVKNALGEFLKQTVQDQYHLRGGRLIRFLRDHPGWRGLLVNAFIRTGTEPNVYLYYRRRESAAGSPPSNSR